jgi:hypothetical protein
VASVEVRRKGVLMVVDRAEIRGTHRAEGMSIEVIARVMGCSSSDDYSAYPAANARRLEIVAGRAPAAGTEEP